MLSTVKFVNLVLFSRFCLLRYYFFFHVRSYLIDAANELPLASITIMTKEVRDVWTVETVLFLERRSNLIISYVAFIAS